MSSLQDLISQYGSGTESYQDTLSALEKLVLEEELEKKRKEEERLRLEAENGAKKEEKRKQEIENSIANVDDLEFENVKPLIKYHPPPPVSADTSILVKSSYVPSVK